MKVKIIFLLMGLFVFIFSKSSFSGNNSNVDNIMVELTNEEKAKIIDDIQSKFPEIMLNKKQIIKYNKLKIQKYKRGNAIGKRMDELFVELMRCTWLMHMELKFAEIREIPSSIQSLCNLKVLDLSNNLIENLPEEIGCLVNLEILNLPDNQISELPKSMNQLTSLVILNLSANYLNNIPDIFGNYNFLKILDLSYNDLLSLPDSIENLDNLDSLHLSYNQLSSVSFLSKIKNLSRLYFVKNFPFVLDAIEVLGKLTHLQKLDLSKSDIDLYCVKSLFDQLKFLEKLTHLCLSKNNIREIPSNLPINLRYLDLSRNNISDIQDIKDINNHNQLRFLNLSGNPLIEKTPKKLSEINIVCNNNYLSDSSCDNYNGYYSDYSYNNNYESEEESERLESFYQKLDASTLRINRKLFAENKVPEIIKSVSLSYDEALQMVEDLLKSINFEDAVKPGFITFNQLINLDVYDSEYISEREKCNKHLFLRLRACLKTFYGLPLEREEKIEYDEDDNYEVDIENKDKILFILKYIHEIKDVDTKIILLMQFCNGFYNCEIGQGIAYRAVLLAICANDFRTGDFLDKLKDVLARNKNKAFANVVLANAGDEDQNVHLLAYYLDKLKDELGLFGSKDCEEELNHVDNNPFGGRHHVLEEFYNFVTPDRLIDWLIDSCKTEEDLENSKKINLAKTIEDKKLRPISVSDIVLYLLSCGLQIEEDSSHWKEFFVSNPYDYLEFPKLTREGAQKLLLFSGFLRDDPVQSELGQKPGNCNSDDDCWF